VVVYRHLANLRVPVEHSIRHLKIFRLLYKRYRICLKPFGLRLNLFAVIAEITICEKGLTRSSEFVSCKNIVLS